MDDITIWIQLKNKCWLPGHIVQSDLGDSTDPEVIIVETREKFFLNNVATFPLDPTHLLDTDNLCTMNNLHEGPLLNTLRRRLSEEKIYTNTGNVLISLNPYKAIANLYNSPLEYFDLTLGLSRIMNTDKRLDPHVYSIANSALRSLVRQEIKELAPRDQSIIVSGESGAGKTEASKHVMNFLIQANESIAKSENVALESNMKNVLTDSSIIFEAFGNAKTVRNDNSSRFGKYIKLQYTDKNELTAAVTETFLLEKSRLVSVGQDERNYHVFYQLLKGNIGAHATAHLLGMTNVEDYKILVEGNCTVISEDVNDAHDFKILVKALQTLGCSEEEVLQLWCILAAILHCGNIVLETVENNGDEAVVMNLPHFGLTNLCSLLGVDERNFQRSCSTQKLIVGKRASINIKSLSLSECHNNILALMKWLYKNLFDWLVKKVNHAHAKHVSDDRLPLCINFTNEKLQQQFNEHVFVSEQEEYQLQGLEWSTISYQDNQHVIDLISKKPLGLLCILEEYGMMTVGQRKADDCGMVSAFDKNHDKLHPAYSKSRFGNDSFIVKHFAGDVQYKADGFIAKNNDLLQEDLIELMICSSSSFLRNMTGCGQPDITAPGYITPVAAPAPPPVPDGIDSASSMVKKMGSATGTVSFQFRQQLDSLMQTLRATEPHYIKCIKPNELKKPCSSAVAVVMEQLRYSGVLEVVRIRREGFPTRMEFKQFYADYEILGTGKKWPKPSDCTDEEARDICKIIGLESMPASNFQIGHSMLFLRDRALVLMNNAVVNFYAKRATRIQALYRGQLSSRKFALMKNSCVLIQSVVRCFIQMNRLYKLKCVIKIQSWRRMIINRRILLKSYAAVRTIQWLYIRTHIKQRFAVKFREFKLRQLNENATKLQSIVRRRRCELRFEKLRFNILTAQVKISGFIRGRLRRFRFLKFKAQVILLQSAARMWRIQAKMKLKHRSARIIQSIIRSKIARWKFLLNCQRIKFVQAHGRKHIARHRYHSIRKHIITVQSIVRRHRAFRKARARLTAVVTLQSFGRMINDKTVYTQHIIAIVTIQSFGRQINHRRKFLASQIAAIQIQASSRGMIARRQYHKQQFSTVKLQSFGRMIVAKHSFCAACVAITMIQTTWRSLSATWRYQRKRMAVIVIQAAARKCMAIAMYKRCLIATTTIQSFGRMICARQVFGHQVISIIMIQALWRRSIFTKRYHHNKSSIIVFQSIVRRFHAKKFVAMQIRAIVSLQSFGRMIIARTQFDHSVISLITLQAWARRQLAHNWFVLQMKRMITLQSYCRMAVARLKYVHDVHQIVVCQSITRRYNAIKRFEHAKLCCIMIQSILRMSPRRHNFHKRVRCVTIINTWVRRFVAKRQFVKCQNSCKRIQVCVRRFLLNHRLRCQVMALHHAAGLGDVREVLDTLMHNPEYLQLRNKWSHYATLLHAAMACRSIRLVEILSPSPSVLLERDIRGWSTAHFMVANNSPLDVCKYLGSILNNYHPLKSTPATSSGVEVNYDSEGDDDTVLKDLAGKSNNLQSSSAVQSVKSGWLKKKNMSGFWQKRWAVLSEDHIIYYQSPQHMTGAKFSIPLAGCTIQRLAGKDPILEIISPNMADKKTFFGGSNKNKSRCFLVESEKDLQEWLMPIKAVAGVGTLRSAPVNYIQGDLIEAWLLESTVAGQQSLMHLLVEAYVSTWDENCKINALKVAAWIVEHTSGAALSALDQRARSVQDIAKQVKFSEMSAYLQEAQVVYAGAGAGAGVGIATAASPAATTRHARLPGPTKLKGYSYLSLCFEEHALSPQQAGSLSKPLLTLTVYNAKKQLVEEVQDILSPVVSLAHSLWWGATWHMQTPLENLESGTYIILEFFNSTSPDCLAWQRLDINAESIDSGDLCVDFFNPIVSGHDTLLHHSAIAPSHLTKLESSSLEFTISIEKRMSACRLDKIRCIHN